MKPKKNQNRDRIWTIGTAKQKVTKLEPEDKSLIIESGQPFLIFVILHDITTVLLYAFFIFFLEIHDKLGIYPNIQILFRRFLQE